MAQKRCTVTDDTTTLAINMSYNKANRTSHVIKDDRGAVNMIAIRSCRRSGRKLMDGCTLINTNQDLQEDDKDMDMSVHKDNIIWLLGT